MPYQPTTNFDDSNGVDLGNKLVTKDYLLSVYGSILDSNIITTTPALWLVGDGDRGQLGVNDTTDRLTPVTTILGGINWEQISAGGSTSSLLVGAVKADGTLWMWGGGATSGTALGINLSGTNLARTTPVTTFTGGTNWKQVSCGGDHVAAIKTDGTLWVWGLNGSGQLGINNISSRSIPTTTILGGTNWKQVSTSLYTTIAVKTDGTLWAWGDAQYGQLGNNLSGSLGTARSTPVTTILGGNTWNSVSIAISLSAPNVLATKTDGTLWVWGINGSGQLGINNISSRSTPTTTILGGNNWKSIACGNENSAAIKTDGTLWVWGSNSSGTLGINNSNRRSIPVTTIFGGTNWKYITVGGFGLSNNMGSIKTDGTLWVWGDNGYGQLGINDNVDKNIPVTTILGGSNWKSVTVGVGMLMAIRSNDII